MLMDLQIAFMSHTACWGLFLVDLRSLIHHCLLEETLIEETLIRSVAAGNETTISNWIPRKHLSSVLDANWGNTKQNVTEMMLW